MAARRGKIWKLKGSRRGPVDEGFQINVQCVSIRAVNRMYGKAKSTPPPREEPSPERHPTFLNKYALDIYLWITFFVLIFGYLHWVSDGETTLWILTSLDDAFRYIGRLGRDYR